MTHGNRNAQRNYYQQYPLLKVSFSFLKVGFYLGGSENDDPARRCYLGILFFA
jgi:hypothetical protein